MNDFQFAEKQLIRRYNRDAVISCRCVTMRKQLELYGNIYKMQLDTYATAISAKANLIYN